MTNSPWTVRALGGLLALVAVLAAPGCTANGGERGVRVDAHARNAIEADGISVRFRRLRVAPSHTKRFEAVMERCVHAARAAALPDRFDWLCYRESPGRYWIITFGSAPDGFADPATFRAFALSIAGAEGETPSAELAAQLDEIEYESEWEIVTRQKAAWSTVEDMSTATHPKARAMIRTIRPGMEAAFDAALTARTAFLRDHGYPLPIEGFAMRGAVPASMRSSALQVVFPVDWPSFHGSASFGAFVRSLDDAEREAYDARKAALLETMSRAEFYDADFAPALSYGAG